MRRGDEPGLECGAGRCRPPRRETSPVLMIFVPQTRFRPQILCDSFMRTDRPCRIWGSSAVPQMLNCETKKPTVTEVPRDASAILGAHLVQTSECSRNGPGQELV